MDNRNEMEDLVKAAGYDIVADLTFKKLHRKNYMGELRFEELNYLVTEKKVKYIVLNEPVSLRYMRYFEAYFDSDDIVVLDKTMLILEIFERKASSSEIQLQIKLAKMKYTEPRMRSELGVNLRTEKQARDRGAGETADQIMKSDFRGRVAKMEAKIRELTRVKELELDFSIPKIPIMGFYSVGKTTLFNILTASNRETSQDAFTTMFMKSSWSKITGYPIELIDTIGLVDLPKAVIDSFSMMLQSIFRSNILVFALDTSGDENKFKQQLTSLVDYYEKFANIDIEYKIIFILTKCDLINQEKYDWCVLEIDEYIKDIPLFSVYDTLGVRSDKPDFVRKSFTNLLDLMIGNDLSEYEFEKLDASEASLVYSHAKILNEDWVSGKVNMRILLPKFSFEKNLSTIKDKLSKKSKEELEKTEMDKELEDSKFVTNDLN